MGSQIYTQIPAQVINIDRRDHCIVPNLFVGEACGKLVEVDRIEPGALDEAKEPVVLLVKRASGDEEIGAAGVDLKGVILCHGLPHLSHLGRLVQLFLMTSA